MTTLSEDVNFFDNTIFDPLIQVPNLTVPNLTIKLKREGVKKGVVEEEVEEDDEDDFEEDYDDDDVHEVSFDVKLTKRENDSEPVLKEEKPEEEGETELFVNCEPKAASEKEDKESDQFTTDLWSEKESSVSRSLDSWDPPLGPVAWDESEKPIERLLNYADLSLTKEEENGLLTDRIVAACSSYLTKSPGNKCHVVAKVSLNNKSLNDIRILGYHRFLQYVDLSWNNLTDITPLGCIPYLMYLDVSHNLLKDVLRFNPPLNLTYVNYSYNEVWQIDDLTDFWAICYLDLSQNNISKIQGLHNLRYLRHLDLSHNKIERFENLNNLRITDLNLEYNLISTFEMEKESGINTMPHLTNLYLNNNLIKSLDFLQGVYHLRKLELQGNSISDLVELSKMKLLKGLRHLDLSGNPVSQQKPYRSLLLNLLQELRFLDQVEVDICERVYACKKNRFDVQLEAARNHARMILLDQLNDTSLDLDVLPIDQSSYPFVILVGPSASSKKFIVSALGEKYPDKIYVGKLHTTRQVLELEKNILQQTSREDFNENIKSGKFLCVTENLGHLYGFSREELSNAVKEHKLCLTSMDMVGALTIHSFGIQPFLVLAILQSKEEHKKRLKLTYGPVLSVLGATYMAQRQLTNSHESNVKRVETILNDTINEALERRMESGLSEGPESVESPESDGSVTSEPSYKKDGLDGKDEMFLQSNSEESQENLTEKSFNMLHSIPSASYTCTPAKCGLQSRLRAKPSSEFSSFNTEEFLRLSASDTEIKSESERTSYSAVAFPPMKPEMSSGEESTIEEVEPFLDWSMPFIDWSEVNLSGLQLEEAAELLCDKYIDNIMSSVEVYRNLHLENPGLFSLCVSTDDPHKATKDLIKFLKEVWRSTPSRQPPFDVTSDPIYQVFVSKKLNTLKEMLRKDFLSADGDGDARVLSDIPANNSPSAICAEMRLKGYGDFLENL